MLIINVNIYTYYTVFNIERMLILLNEKNTFLFLQNPMLAYQFTLIVGQQKSISLPISSYFI